MHTDGAIRFLRSGIVPAQQVRMLSVGYGKLDTYITKHLGTFCYNEKVEPLFVRGEWGSGKSHFLAYMQSTALEGGIPVAALASNARTSALNYPQRMYAQLAAGFRQGNCVGLRDFLITKASDPRFRSDFLTAIGRSNSSLAVALRHLLQQFTGNVQNLLSMSDSFAWAIALGADIAWADYAYKKEQALARLEELSGICRRAGMHGLVILLDELETIDQLWNVRSRIGAYAVLGRLCRNPNILPVFAITERFDRVVDSDIDRGVASTDGIASDARWFLAGWKRREWPQLVPPSFSLESATGILDRISSLYVSAYDSPALTVAQKTWCMTQWERNAGRNPRQLIRLAVDALDRLRPLQQHV